MNKLKASSKKHIEYSTSEVAHQKSASENEIKHSEICKATANQCLVVALEYIVHRLVKHEELSLNTEIKRRTDQTNIEGTCKKD